MSKHSQDNAVANISIVNPGLCNEQGQCPIPLTSGGGGGYRQIVDLLFYFIMKVIAWMTGMMSFEIALEL